MVMKVVIIVADIKVEEKVEVPKRKKKQRTSHYSSDGWGVIDLFTVGADIIAALLSELISFL
jgi:hypothetical protein